MRAAVLAALALAACDPTIPAPVWMPGQPPLVIWAETDAAWAAMDAGCAAWRMTGLRCRRVAAREDAQLEVDVADAGDAAGKARFTYSASGWVWSIVLDPVHVDDPAVAAHEIGHTLGIVDHLEPGNLMSPAHGSATPTEADLEALADVWGEAPWLE